MAQTEVLFYIIVVVMVVATLLFWIIYLTIRRRRLRRQLEARVVDTCYEELPAVPQPAYVFSGLSPEDIRHVALIESLPGYQHDDPMKNNAPPPKYGEVHADHDRGEPSRPTIDALLDSIESNDMSRLIDNQEDEDCICMQQVT